MVMFDALRFARWISSNGQHVRVEMEFFPPSSSNIRRSIYAQLLQIIVRGNLRCNLAPWVSTSDTSEAGLDASVLNHFALS